MTLLAWSAFGCLVGLFAFGVTLLVLAVHRRRPTPHLAASVLGRIQCNCGGGALLHEAHCPGDRGAL